MSSLWLVGLEFGWFGLVKKKKKYWRSCSCEKRLNMEGGSVGWIWLEEERLMLYELEWFNGGREVDGYYVALFGAVVSVAMMVVA